MDARTQIYRNGVRVSFDTMLDELDEEEPRGAAAYDLLRHLHLAERTEEAEPFLLPALDHLAANYHASYASRFLDKVGDGLGGAEPASRFADAPRRRRQATHPADQDRRARATP